jgi:Cys-tRNA(Pro) deacylase
MSVETVRSFFQEKAPDIEVTEHNYSTASVAEAAETIGVEPGQIAKTLAVKIGERVVLVVTRGDARLDNKKLKAAFGGRPSMLSIDVVAEITGHPVGGVCPFGLAKELPIYCDVTLKDFDIVHPAAGSKNSSVCITPTRMAELTNAEWTDVCQSTQPSNDQ